MENFEGLHQEVWDKLDNLNLQVYQLKRANTKLNKDLRYQRRENGKLRKMLSADKQHYRNGQKKGRTRNG